MGDQTHNILVHDMTSPTNWATWPGQEFIFKKIIMCWNFDKKCILENLENTKMYKQEVKIIINLPILR